jgi:hypothetical protein
MYPMESILEDISPDVAKIKVPTILLAGELDQVDSIERHKTEVLAHLPNADFKIIKGIVVRNNRSRRVLHVEYDFPGDLKEAMSQLLDCLAVWSDAYAENAETSCEWSTSEH